MRNIIVFIFGLVLLLTGCSTETGITEVGVYKAEDIHFEDGSGRVTIVFEEPYINDGAVVDGLIDVIVLAKGLNPNEKYEISLKGENNQGVIFGPKENINLRFGVIEGETLFHPNKQGELFVSMKNPIRVVSEANEVRVIVSQGGKEILRTNPFILAKKVQ